MWGKKLKTKKRYAQKKTVRCSQESAVSVQHRGVTKTNRQTDGRTDGHRTIAYIVLYIYAMRCNLHVSRGKKIT